VGRTDRILYPAPRFPPRQTHSAPLRTGPGAEHDGPHGHTAHATGDGLDSDAERAGLILIFRGVGTNGDSPPAGRPHSPVSTAFAARLFLDSARAAGRGASPRRNGKGQGQATKEKQPPSPTGVEGAGAVQSSGSDADDRSPSFPVRQ